MKICGASHDGQSVLEEPRPITLVEDISISQKLKRAGCEACEIPMLRKKRARVCLALKPVVQFLLGLSWDIFCTDHCTMSYTCVLTLHTDVLGKPVSVISFCQVPLDMCSVVRLKVPAELLAGPEDCLLLV